VREILAHARGTMPVAVALAAAAACARRVRLDIMMSCSHAV